MVIAHELDTLKFVDAHSSKRQIYSLLLDNARLHASKGRQHEGYSYVVPNQWQGRFRTLEVIGDKKGGMTTRRLRAKPGLLRRLVRTVDIPLKLVHVVRNPYDNISRIALQSTRPVSEVFSEYFSECETVARVAREVGADAVLHLRHDVLIENPDAQLSELCRFLGPEAASDYLRDCSSIIDPAQPRPRDQVEWTREAKDTVAREMDRYGFLRDYSFDE